MTQGFFQFNNSIIDEIINFSTSTFDLLFMSGPKGASKSETIEKIIPQLLEQSLVFQHFCFDNSVIDDFLLNFYDGLRNFSIAQKISLKKFTTDNFKDKVSHYFKTIEKDCIIIVENFEKIDENIEIIDFLSHLATYKNVKIIIVSRSNEKNLFRFKKIKMKTLEIEQIKKEDFKTKLAILTEPVDIETKEKFYQITKGLELYLKMSAKFCTNTGISIKDLIAEYERKNALSYIDFEEFIVSKFVSSTPSVYQNLFKALCTLSHPVDENFLSTYKLANVGYIDYLVKNFLVAKFKNEYYIKDYFKEYILKSFSIQEKITRYKNLIEIYENELTKSPKDRLLRLSRESIRKEIEFFKSLIPSINTSSKSSNSFSYLGITATNWHDEKLREKTKLADKLNKIKERKNLLAKEKVNFFNTKPNIEEPSVEEIQKDRMLIITLINSARDLTKQYRYQESINELSKAKDEDFDNEFSIEISTLIAKNYEFLNDYIGAQKFYESALDIARETKDSRKCELEFSIALTNKNLFKIDFAKNQFKQIAQNETNPQNYRAKAFLELGELEEASSNIDSAITQYNQAISLSLSKYKDLVCKGYYKLAVLYDENQDIENAIRYYQKNYITSSEKKENQYYGISLTNLALIYIEQSKYKEASELLKLALMFDSENNDLENMYYTQKELAKLYTKIDEVSAIGYFKQALNCAKKLSDTFKEALIYFEVGEYYYDKEDDENALKNFLFAKNILKINPNDENISRVDTRIQDISMRQDEMTFNLIMEKYGK